MNRRRTWSLQINHGQKSALLQETTATARAFTALAGISCALEVRAWPWKIGPSGRKLGDLLFEVTARCTVAADRRTTTVAELPIDRDLADSIDPILADIAKELDRD